MNDSDSDDCEKEHLRKENEELKRELKASTLHLATLAHKEYQVPDGSIREDYQRICRAFETWIDYASSDGPGDFKTKFRDALKSEEKTYTLRAIGIEYQPPAASDPKLDCLKSSDMLHYLILSLLIGKYVFYAILKRQYPLGVTESQEDTLLGIEKEMVRMGKAKSKISQWKADSLAALCASREYKDEQSKLLSRLQNALERDLSFWFDFGPSSRSKSRLRTEILEPSVKLHLEMQCSTQNYEFVDETYFQSRRNSSNGEYSLDVVKEISTWKTITSDGTEDVFQCVYPGLVVHSMETEDVSELVGPIMAVYKKTFGQHAKRSTTSSSVKSSSRGDNLPKETREPKQQKTTTSALSGFANSLFRGSGRKSGDDRQPPEQSIWRRRASRDTGSKHSQHSSSSYDEAMSYTNSSQPLQGWPARGSPTKYSRILTPEPRAKDEAISQPEGYEVVEYTATPQQPYGYYQGRPSVSDGT
ncbi:uncharacterized protein Bfra_009880 [Botrytis fragariae]|uniref:Uncharacterized protein n=1 Tax=Botrytis fragariae TaxID=1964551 RepID=A0A8H6AN23_9HELO|nr:uncharacterized protein Bfra_009880 [Botrytis fragariae]KAF5870492.1 hypothetical protein Bfra_009880 [Botrytis fragariae]